MSNVETVMRYCRNYFPGKMQKNGVITIANGVVTGFDVPPYRWFLIEGSGYNDGVHQCGMDALSDEVFSGTVTLLNPPVAFLELCQKIERWTENNTPSAFVSESFGGYSYNRATVNGKMVDWTAAFAGELKVFRKV